MWFEEYGLPIKGCERSASKHTQNKPRPRQTPAATYASRSLTRIRWCSWLIKCSPGSRQRWCHDNRKRKLWMVCWHFTISCALGRSRIRLHVRPC
jgi:hypothetical protein